MTAPRRRRLTLAVAAALLLTGCGTGDAEQPQGVSPTAPASTAAAAPEAPSSASLPEVLPESEPTSVQIDEIGVDAPLLHLGLRDNGSLEVPPTAPGSPAAWYDQSPTPGERGPAVLLGHVNEDDGSDGVFADLRALEPGDTVEVEREDGSTATFEVTRGEAYSKDDFATDEVYGNTAGSELRLITCDGYDEQTGLWDDNYVVYAQLAV